MSAPLHMAMSYVLTPPKTASVPVLGVSEGFPVHRVYCVDRNYVQHAQEMSFSGREPPFFFLKPADAVVPVDDGPSVTIAYPSLTENFQYEIELAVAIGEGRRSIKAQHALSHVFGYAVGLDMTRSDRLIEMRKQGRPWCVGKAFDESAPIGHIVPASDVPKVADATIWLQVDGEDRQCSSTGRLIWNVPEIIEHLSTGWELQPGDLIFTGTPEGVGPVQPGELITSGIDGIGTLSVRVASR